MTPERKRKNYSQTVIKDFKGIGERCRNKDNEKTIISHYAVRCMHRSHFSLSSSVRCLEINSIRRMSEFLCTDAKGMHPNTK